MGDRDIVPSRPRGSTPAGTVHPADVKIGEYCTHHRTHAHQQLLFQRHVRRNVYKRRDQSHFGALNTSTSNTMATDMKQWQTGQDGLDKLTMATVKIPVPKDGEVLVKIHTVSLNFRDTEGTGTLPTGKQIHLV